MERKRSLKQFQHFFYLVSLRPIFYIPVPAESSLLEEKTCPSSRLNIIYLLKKMRKVCENLNFPSLSSLNYCESCSIAIIISKITNILVSVWYFQSEEDMGGWWTEVRGLLKIYQSQPGLYHCIYTLIDSPCLNCKPAGHCPVQRPGLA